MGLTAKSSVENTLAYNSDLCINCKMCTIVCPHGIFVPDGKVVAMAHQESCMECGACRRNCPTGAISVDSGVGCACALIYSALTGKKEPTCGGEEKPCC